MVFTERLDHIRPSSDLDSAAGKPTALSSYGARYKREEFPKLVEIAEPKITCHRRRMHLFTYDTFE